MCFLCIHRSHVASAASNAAAISAASQQAAAMHAGAFNSYTGQLAVSVQENAAANGQWAECKLYQFAKTHMHIYILLLPNAIIK